MTNHSSVILEFCDDCPVEIDPRDYRALAYVDFQAGYHRDECYERLFSHFGEHGPSRGRISAWYIEFRRESRLPPQGLSLSSILQEATKAARRLIRRNRRVGLESLRKALGLSQTELQRILEKELGLARRHSHWLPYSLDDNLKLTRLNWSQRLQAALTEDSQCVIIDEFPLARSPESKPIVRTNSVVAFFNRSGFMFSAVVQRFYPAQNERNNDENSCFTVHSLPMEDLGSRSRSRTTRRLLLRYARHAESARTLLPREGLDDADFVGDPPNSPDLVPADFGIYPRVREALARRSFASREDIAVAYDAAVRAIGAADCERIFDDWLFRVKRCIAAQGDYFEEPSEDFKLAKEDRKRKLP